jgi:hypothetical protein
MATEGNVPAGKSGIADRLKDDSRQKIESGKRSAADQIDQVAQALNRAGEELNQSQPTLANYASQFASSVSTFANRLRDGNMDELLSDTRELARRNPGMFLLGGVALGFALSRFLKASAEQMQAGEYSGTYTEDYSGEYGSQAGDHTRGEFGTSDYAEGGSYSGATTTGGVESSGYSGTRSRDDLSGSRSNGG